MRVLTVFLLILIVFFGGMMYGSYEKDQYTLGLSKEEQLSKEVEAEVMQVEPYQTEIKEPQPPVDLGEEVPFIHKVASFLETIFTSIYALILQLLFRIAELFY